MSRYQKITFDEFEQMVEDHNSTLTDVVSGIDYFNYKAGKVVNVQDSYLFGNYIQSGTCNDNGFSQLCDKLNAPASWLASGKCPVDLEETIINRMKNEYKGDELLFRFRNVAENEFICRAVLSKQYTPYDNQAFWSSIRDGITGTGLENLKPVIWKPYVSDYMNAWILFETAISPDKRPDVKLYDNGKADGLNPAIHIRNAEDGTGSLRIESGFYRSYCTNGIIFGFNAEAELRQIHKYSNKQIISAKIKIALAEAAKSCSLAIDEFLKATEIHIKKDVLDEVVDFWSKEFSLNVNVNKDLKTVFSQVSTWADAVMVVSDYAGSKVDSDESYKLERMAGQMLQSGAKKHYIERR